MDEKEIVRVIESFGVDVPVFDKQAIEKWLRRRNLDALVHYLVDWLVFGPTDQLVVIIMNIVTVMTLSALLVPLIMFFYASCPIFLFIFLFIVSIIVSIWIQPDLILLTLILIIRYLYI